MTLAKARQTKHVYMHARVAVSDKEALQRWAEHRGVSLSALLSVTIKNMADIARQRMSRQSTADYQSPSQQSS
jgi:hypothetical protein